MQSTMLIQVVWLAAMGLEGILLFRSLRTRMLARYPLFYSYIAFVFFNELVRLFAYYNLPETYERIYWATQFPSLLVGCSIIFEVYRVGLRNFPGTARMARNLLLFVFAMVFAKAIVNGLDGLPIFAKDSSLILERNLRIVQSCALIALVIAFLFYAIPLSRNLRGIMLGYGIFLGCSIAQLTIMNRLGERILAVWFYLQPVSYLIVLTVWAATLWNYSQEPTIDRTIRLDQDYRILRQRTLSRFRRSRAALGKAVRP